MSRYLVMCGVVLLVILHHDWWNWNDGHLVFGFLPVGLAYHAVISLAASALWLFAVFVAWPENLEDEPQEPKTQESNT